MAIVDPATTPSVAWKEYVDSLHKQVEERLESVRVVGITAVESVRREQDILATHESEAAAKILQTVQQADLATQRKFERVQSQIDGLNTLKTDLAIQVSQVESLRREMALTQDAANTAIQKAEHSTEKRLEGVNEFRSQLSDQAQTFMPREVADVALGEIRKQIGMLTGRVDTAAGKSLGSGATVGLIASGVGILGTIILAANGIFG